MTDPAFTVWTFAGVRYLAFPNNSGFHVVDEAGNNYGAWSTLESCRKCQRGEAGFPFQSLGKMELSGRIVAAAEPLAGANRDFGAFARINRGDGL